MSSSPNLGYFLCEEVSPMMATLPAESEWSVWQNEQCTLASRSVDECACAQGEGVDGEAEGAAEGWRWRWCTVQMRDCAMAVMVEMTHCKRDECAKMADEEWPRRRLIVVPLTPELVAAIPSLAPISSQTRSELSGSKAPSVAPCVPPHPTPSALPLVFVPRSTEASDAALVAPTASRRFNRFSSIPLSTAYSTPSTVFSTPASDRAPFIPTRALPLVSTPPLSRCLPVATDVLPIPLKSRLLKPVTANALAEVSPSPLYPVSSSSSPIHDSSSPLSYHSFNIPLSDSPDSNADYNQHYSPYDKVTYEKDFSEQDFDQDIIDEFLIPDRQQFYQFDCSPTQFDSLPSSPSFYSFIDDIIGEVREEIHIEKSSPSPSDTLAESISLIAHSDIDAKLKIVTSSGCSDKAYKVTIEPVKKSRKRLAAPPPPSGVKKERIDISKLTREEAAERKRYQNRVAAQRYRAKIREERDSEFNECAFLEERNEFLREQDVILSAEIAKYKALLLDRAATQ